MRKVKVLFFSADAKSAHGGAQRLLLDEDVRQIRQKVRAAEHRDALEFDLRPAARTDDLLQALNEARPQVVHFSGHGRSEGLMLVSADGLRPHLVEGEVLKELFGLFRGDIRVVVLNACFSLPQARAIADAVGCAIGTRGEISDAAAITFGASFYRAVAFGHPVQAAYEQARLALRLEHFADRECPQLVVRPGVDPDALVLVEARAEPAAPGGGAAAGVGASPEGTARRGETTPSPTAAPPRADTLSRGTKWLGAAATALVLATGAVLAPDILRDRGSADPSVSGPAGEGDPRTAGAVPRGAARTDSATDGTASPRGLMAPPPAAVSTPSSDPSRAAADVDAARALYQAGNHAAAFPMFQRAAEAGNPEAMGFVGMMYLRGQGTARSPELAIVWLRRAGEERDPRGMNALGVAYEKGDGVGQSYRWARHWYLAAAEEKGYAEAMRNLGGLYRSGLGVEQSDAVALDWYRKAAHAGSLDAMVDVGSMYERGLGVARNPRLAVQWYRTAAEAGLPRGMVSLGMLYQEGVGVTRDFGEARGWYLKAANAGSADAMNNLGVLFQNGWGVPRNAEEAVRWFRKAAAAGSTVAEGNLAALGTG